MQPLDITLQSQLHIILRLLPLSPKKLNQYPSCYKQRERTYRFQPLPDHTILFNLLRDAPRTILQCIVQAEAVGRVFI
jgi:hypothetical protein